MGNKGQNQKMGIYFYGMGIAFILQNKIKKARTVAVHRKARMFFERHNKRKQNQSDKRKKKHLCRQDFGKN